MRLIDTKDLSVREFQGTQIPEYAILSHRWEDGEITLKELVETGGQTSSEPAIYQSEKAGWKKLHNFRNFARTRGHQYIWLDTCCIDKTSSAELSEAINSMYQWYAKATVCYAYLCDVPAKRNWSSEKYWSGEDSRSSEKRRQWSEKFRRSVIWSRGWTLQELLAPPNVVFVCSDWREEIGTKDTLSADISEATSIPEAVVRRYRGCTVTRPRFSRAVTVVEVMCWASSRVCTRIEDKAYCLMGLFGISMPLLYGEGNNAFLRLQLEIINRTDDESIFAWRGYHGGIGLLAPDPSSFLRYPGRTYHLTKWDARRPPYAMTNKGLRFEPLLFRCEDLEMLGPGATENWMMPLNVDVEFDGVRKGLAVLLNFRANGINTRGVAGTDPVREHDYEPNDTRFERRTIFFQQSWTR